MTRDKLIKSEASKERTMPQERAFLRGADFADNHCWLAVEEELPQIDQPYYDDGLVCNDLKISLPVIVATDNGEYHIATLNQNYNENGKKSDSPYWFDENNTSNGDWLDGHVTHWMPLPQAPKKGD